MARPTMLTEQLTAEYVAALGRLLYLETAASFIGVCRKSVLNWLCRGRREERRLQRNPRAKPKESEAIYVRFLRAIKKRLAEIEAHALDAIQSAEQWTAHAWLLERRFPERWSQDRKVIRQILKEMASLEARLRERSPAGTPVDLPRWPAEKAG